MNEAVNYYFGIRIIDWKIQEISVLLLILLFNLENKLFLSNFIGQNCTVSLSLSYVTYRANRVIVHKRKWNLQNIGR